jgi:hypothetical protein
MPVMQVQVVKTGPDGVDGLAVLSASEAGTAVQVLAVGAPAGLTAAIHAGDCAAVDPAPVGLLGELQDGQAQATVPLSLAAIGDGGYVVAFHPGLDLAAILGCGAIPRVDVPVASPPVGAPDSGGTFTGSRYGFTIAWDGTWTQVEAAVVEGVDGVTLNDGNASVRFGAVPAFEGSAEECLRNWEQQMLDLAGAGGISELTKLAVDQVPAEGATPGPAAAYRYSTSREDGTPAQLVDHYECRSLGNGVVLEIVLTSPADLYADAIAHRSALLAGLTLPGMPAPPIGEVEPSAAPEPEPEVIEPAPEPVATLDPSCAGLEMWAEATTARFDRIEELTTEARLLFAYDYINFVAEFGGIMASMTASQAIEPVPPVAAGANQQAIEAYGLLERSARVQYGIALNPPSSPTEASRALREAARDADEGLELAAVLRGEIGRLKAACGLPVG